MHWLWAWDQALFLRLNGRPSGGLARGAAVLFMHLSSGGLLWLALFALGFLGGGRRGRRIALTGALAVLLAHAAAVWALAGLVQRSDPAQVVPGTLVLGPFQPRFSFPASRVAEAFAALPYLSRGGRAPTTLFWCLGLAVAFSCVYVGAAFPTDVLGGALVGWGCAALARWLLGNPFRPRRGQVVPLSRAARH